ncbi:MAG: hypothetical protein M3158_03070 [Pseudomonadota bacterium]|nr:hypothetical protein [Pseudomonadota bacterium]
MRKTFVFVAFLALGAGAALADEPDPFLTLEQAKPYRERWQTCTATAAKENLEGTLPAAEIADRAFEHCKAREAALRNVLKRRLGAASANRIVDDLRGFDRSLLIRVIEKLRSS